MLAGHLNEADPQIQWPPLLGTMPTFSSHPSPSQSDVEHIHQRCNGNCSLILLKFTHN
jgi:hypothetical protein